MVQLTFFFFFFFFLPPRLEQGTLAVEVGYAMQVQNVHCCFDKIYRGY